jgi:hypothetical protein
MAEGADCRGVETLAAAGRCRQLRHSGHFDHDCEVRCDCAFTRSRLVPRLVPAPPEKLCRLIDKDVSFAFLVAGAMAVALSSNELERTIEVLSNAGQTLQLTSSETLSYRALLVSADGVLVSSIALLLIAYLNEGYILFPGGGTASDLSFGASAFAFAVSSVAGIISLLLNIPLLLKTFREESRLKRLGLDALSKSLWKESRRSRWMSRFRGILLLSIGFVFLAAILTAFSGHLKLTLTFQQERLVLYGMALYSVIVAGLLFTARYLRNQRERMDLAASAGELRNALVSLRQREGPEFVSVPAQLLERTAKIESAQISRERKDAVLQSAAFRPNAYAVAFNRDTAEQRATLDVADRVELEDLVAELSTNGAQPEAHAQSEANPDRFLGTTKSKGVEIEYVINHASRGIRVMAVRHGRLASLNGAGRG